MSIKRINVVGVSASGKSTVAKRVAEKFQIPYIEMDQLFWKANWTTSTDEEFFGKLSNVLEQEAWVLDGNYTRTIPIKWERVQLVIWVDMPFATTLFQSVKRAVCRILSGQELWPNTGNKETFKKTFMSKDSIILWMLKNYSKVKQSYIGQMNNESNRHIKFVRLRSRAEVDEFILSL